MKEKIINELKQIEKNKNVIILFAIESGSRAWGFPSKNSDYDVRFVYIHNLEWYLSIYEKKDVLEYPINNLLDINGWDLQKTLKLFSKSNPSIMEWINSPIIYRNKGILLDELRVLSSNFFSYKASMYHYLNMAKSNYRMYLKCDYVKIKKYFYVLRPLLCCKWILDNKSIPPLDFHTLVSNTIKDQELTNEINSLLIKKRESYEMDLEPKIDSLNQFIDKEISYFKNILPSLEDNNVSDIKKLNDLFLKVIKNTSN